MIGGIERLELVKDVNLDVAYRRDLLNEKTSERDRVGAFVDGKKRPGKIFTSMSFGDGDGRDQYYTAIANSTISWGRQLLSQVRFYLFIIL